MNNLHVSRIAVSRTQRVRMLRLGTPRSDRRRGRIQKQLPSDHSVSWFKIRLAVPTDNRLHERFGDICRAAASSRCFEGHINLEGTLAGSVRCVDRAVSIPLLAAVDPLQHSLLCGDERLHRFGHVIELLPQFGEGLRLHGAARVELAVKAWSHAVRDRRNLQQELICIRVVVTCNYALQCCYVLRHEKRGKARSTTSSSC